MYKRREAEKEKIGIYNGYGWGYVMPQPWSPETVSVAYQLRSHNSREDEEENGRHNNEDASEDVERTVSSVLYPPA